MTGEFFEVSFIIVQPFVRSQVHRENHTLKKYQPKVQKRVYNLRVSLCLCKFTQA